MTYERFEDLPVWRDAIRLAAGCEDFLLAAKESISWSKRDQMDRASLSVSNNIAEGFERGTTAEMLSFLYIARGSAGEVRSMLCYFESRPSLAQYKVRMGELKGLAESCSRQLRGWAESLQNSDIKGQRHLNKESRGRWEKKKMEEKRLKDYVAMTRPIVAKMPPDHPTRIDWERRHGPA